MDKCVNREPVECVKAKEPTAKERVQIELEELNGRIVKLSAFLYSEKAIAENISGEMRCVMRDQLRYMSDYATALQHRLAIWGKTDEELKEENRIL